MIVTDLFHPTRFQQEQLWRIWKQEKRSFRLKPPGRAYGREFAWQQWLYVNRLHKEALPAVIYLPVPDQFRMITPAWDWQSRLCVNIIAPLDKDDTFSLHHCLHYLRQHIRSPKSAPLIKSFNSPVYQYLKLLEQVQLIQEITPNIFVKKQTVSFHQHAEDALYADMLLMDQIMKQNAGMNQV